MTEIIRNAGEGLKRRRVRYNQLYPFADMKVRDGFEVPFDKRHSVRSAACQWAKRQTTYGIRFVVQVTPGNKETVLVWRES